MRRTSSEATEQTLDALESALLEVGLDVRLHDTTADDLDFVLDVNGQRVVVEVKSILRTGDADALVRHARQLNLPLLVAAERIAKPVRAALKDTGVSFYDRRGRLRLVLPGVLVDTEVGPDTPRPGEAAPLSGEVAKEAAIALLSGPEARLGVREIARHINRAPSAVSGALDRLRAAGLVTSSNEPLAPDLFWELEGAWHRESVALAALPKPGQALLTDQLQLGLGTGDTNGWIVDQVGWALTDTLAAAAWGMPIVATGSYPPDFYVPSATVLGRAVTTLGRAASNEERACTISLAPVRLVCSRRVDRPGQSWPVADHIVVALDLAADRSRGREVLDRWNPPGIARVW